MRWLPALLLPLAGLLPAILLLHFSYTEAERAAQEMPHVSATLPPPASHGRLHITADSIGLWPKWAPHDPCSDWVAFTQPIPDRQRADWQFSPSPDQQWTTADYLAALPNCLKDRVREEHVTPAALSKSTLVEPSEEEFAAFLSKTKTIYKHDGYYRNRSVPAQFKLQSPRFLTRGQRLDSMHLILRDFSKLIALWDLPVWLEAGSLIAALRTGRLLPWDLDMDVAMTTATYERLRLLVKTRSQDVPPTLHFELDLREYYPNYVEGRVFDKTTGIWLDLFRYMRVGPWYFRWHHNKFYTFAVSWVDPLLPCTLAGFQFVCPFASQTYLEHYFSRLQADRVWNSTKSLFLRNPPAKQVRSYADLTAQPPKFVTHDSCFWLPQPEGVEWTAPHWQWDMYMYQQTLPPCLGERTPPLQQPYFDVSRARAAMARSNVVLRGERQRTAWAEQTSQLDALRSLLRALSLLIQQANLPIWLHADLLAMATYTGRVDELPSIEGLSVAASQVSFLAFKHLLERGLLPIPEGMHVGFLLFSHSSIRATFSSTTAQLTIHLHVVERHQPWLYYTPLPALRKMERVEQEAVALAWTHPLQPCFLEGSAFWCPFDAAKYLADSRAVVQSAEHALTGE